MLESLAKKVDEAARNACSIQQLSESHEFSLADAYEIQRLSIERRLQRAEKLIGYKMGFTSKAKMLQMGVDDLIWGRLTDQMVIEEGGEISLDRFVHPRVGCCYLRTE